VGLRWRAETRRGKKRESSTGQGAWGQQSQPSEAALTLRGPRHRIGVRSRGQPFLTARPPGVRRAGLQQLRALPALVPRAPERVKRGGEKRRKKTEGWERAARSGAVCTGLDVSSACLSLLHKSFCQQESQTAEHAAHTHARTDAHAASAAHACTAPSDNASQSHPSSSTSCPFPPLLRISRGAFRAAMAPPASGTPRAQPSGRAALLPRLLPPCMSWLGSQPWASRVGANLVSQGHQLAGTKAWEWACAGVWLLSWAGKKTAPSPGCSLFRMNLPKCCPWGSAGTDLFSGALSPRLLTVLLKSPLSWFWWSSFSPLGSHPASLGSELGTEGLARAASAGAGRELLPLS